MEATSQYLNMRCRELSEIDEGGQGDASTERCDTLRHFIGKLALLRSQMVLHDKHLLGDYIAQVTDMAEDMWGQMRMIEEEERYK